MSAGVYRAVLACLQVYAIQCYVCGHVPYIALVCRCIPFRIEICLQAYTIQCLSAGVCNTALCLRACTVHRACLQVYAVQSHFCRCMRISRTVRAARAVVMHQYRTAQDCSRAGACCIGTITEIVARLSEVLQMSCEVISFLAAMWWDVGSGGCRHSWLST